MMIRHLSSSKTHAVVLLSCSIFLLFLPGIFPSGVVTLQSIEIFKTHEWINAKPTVYFRCNGENMTMLPDVKDKHFVYKFKSEESWQPLTEFNDTKCKRCGLYEKDTIDSDDVFDEWEFCPSDFIAPDGKYVHFKDNEFNATFLCAQCIAFETGSNQTHGSNYGAGGVKGMNIFLVIMIIAVVLIVSIFGAVAGYKFWQRKKREQDQARFLKLFEDGDDIEDELGLGHII